MVTVVMKLIDLLLGRKAMTNQDSVLKSRDITLPTKVHIVEAMSHQAPLSMIFSRQGYWSGSPFPSPGDLPNPGIELGSPALQADSLPTELQGALDHFLLHSEMKENLFFLCYLNVMF